jgi:hypothetical protein
MKRGVMKNATWYALIALIVAVAILPILKAMAPQIFPEGFRGGRRCAGEGFTAPPPAAAAAQPPNGCDGAPCSEGQFCGQDKKCWPIYVGGANGSVPEGSE